MLALVQAHNVLWFLPVTLAGAVLFAITTTLKKRGVAMRPVIPAACWCLAAGGIAGMDFGRFESADWGKMVETLFAAKK